MKKMEYSIPNFEIVNPKNDKGYGYDIEKELYATNSFGNYKRFTNMEGGDVADWDDWFIDHVTGMKYKNANDNVL